MIEPLESRCTPSVVMVYDASTGRIADIVEPDVPNYDLLTWAQQEYGFDSPGVRHVVNGFDPRDLEPMDLEPGPRVLTFQIVEPHPSVSLQQQIAILDLALSQFDPWVDYQQVFDGTADVQVRLGDFFQGAAATNAVDTIWLNPASRHADFVESLLVHEVGHFVGLEHREILPSVMQCGCRAELTWVDVWDLQELYKVAA